MSVILSICFFPQADWFNACIFDLVHPDDVEKIREQLSTQESPNAGRILDLKSNSLFTYTIFPLSLDITIKASWNLESIKIKTSLKHIAPSIDVKKIVYIHCFELSLLWIFLTIQAHKISNAANSKVEWIRTEKIFHCRQYSALLKVYSVSVNFFTSTCQNFPNTCDYDVPTIKKKFQWIKIT